MNGQSEKGPSVGWVGGMRKGAGLVRSTVNSQIFSSVPALAVTCCESVSLCILLRAEVTLGGAGPHGMISAFTGPMRHIGPVVLALPWARLCALDPDASSHAHASPSLGIRTPSRQTCRPTLYQSAHGSPPCLCPSSSDERTSLLPDLAQGLPTLGSFPAGSHPSFSAWRLCVPLRALSFYLYSL